MMMISRPLLLALMLASASPLAAQTEAPLVPPELPQDAPDTGSDIEEGFDMFGEAARRLLRGLASEMEPALDDMGKSLSELEPWLRDLSKRVGDMRHYEKPETLPNGDILIRRKADAPPMPEPEPELDPLKPGEMDL